jgi:hypothetical protein
MNDIEKQLWFLEVMLGQDGIYLLKLVYVDMLKLQTLFRV